MYKIFDAVRAFFKLITYRFKSSNKHINLNKPRNAILFLLKQSASKTFTPEEKTMISNILRLNEVKVQDIMIARAEIEAIEINQPVDDILRNFEDSNHSRLPVYKDNLDNPVGVLHIKDFISLSVFPRIMNITNYQKIVPEIDLLENTDISATQSYDDLAKNEVKTDISGLKLSKAIRPLLFVPPSMRVTDLLTTMQLKSMHMALVIDEYGGTDGLVCLEDLVETIVGDIEDEHDAEDETPFIILEDGIITTDANTSLNYIKDKFGINLIDPKQSDSTDTVGGLVFSQIGRVPIRGEIISSKHIGYQFEITEADARRIKKVKIYKQKKVMALKNSHK